jgi:hypothetical protein
MMANRPANDEMVRGYLDGFDVSSPEPSENRSHAYRHGFKAGRSDRGVKAPWATAAEAVVMADEAMSTDDDLMQPRR